jgi:large subunit ribosomal protein L25
MFELSAERREAQGTGASRRLRRAGKIPAVIYGGDKAPEMLSFDHNTIFHLLENEAFHSSILKVSHGGVSEQAILRDVHYHPYKLLVLHLDFQRVSASEKIHMKVPLHFLGQDVAPGVKLKHGIPTHIITEVDVICLPANLPEFLALDVSGLDLGESLHLSDIKLPEGVELTVLAHGGDDQAVVAIVPPKAAAAEEEAPAAPAAGEAAGESGESK